MSSARAEGGVVVLGGARVDAEAQFHRRAALEREQGFAVLAAHAVEHGADDLGVEPALVAADRHVRRRRRPRWPGAAGATGCPEACGLGAHAVTVVSVGRSARSL